MLKRIALIITISCSIPIVNIALSSGNRSINIYWVDLGINQWSRFMRMMDDFTGLTTDQKETVIVKNQKGQILVPMPDDERLPTNDTGWKKLSDDIYRGLKLRLNNSVASGMNDVEIRTVQNINTKGYFNPFRQSKVIRFNQAFSNALGRLKKEMSSGNIVKIYGVWGSNGGYAASRIKNNPADRGVLVDARAKIGDVKRLFKSLSGNLSIINTAGDAPSDITMVANHDTAKMLKIFMPDLRVFWIDSKKGLNVFVAHHLESAHWDTSFKVKEFTGSGYARYGSMTGGELREYIFSNRGQRRVVSLEVNKGAAEHCLETAAALEKTLNYLDKKYYKSGAEESKLAGNIKDLYDFIDAFKKDIERSQNSKFTIMSSHTLEQLGKFGLGNMPEFVAYLQDKGHLSQSFKLPATFGAEEFAVAIGKHIGSGKADIDTITNYLDGMNKAMWGIVGYMHAGPKGARLYQSIAGTGAKLLRDATLPWFEKGVTAWRGQGKELTEQWRTLQERRIHDGLAVQTITEVYGEELLLKNGLSKKDIQGLDNEAHNINQNIINMKKDLSAEKIETLKHSDGIELGGIEINPRLIYIGKADSEIKSKVIKSRPSQDSLSWPTEVPDR